MSKTSITELQNELTNDIDVVGADGIVRLLRQADAQIFNGWREYAGLYDEAVLQTLERLVNVVGRALSTHDNVCIVMSGAGTSGRLAFIIARKFNAALRELGYPECFYYLMAGGDKALIRAQEGAEDDPITAVRDLQQFEKSNKTIIYIGITCGCSAPYIAAQLDYAMHKPQYVTVLLGFNPLDRARRVAIEGWDKTFHSVMSELASYTDDRHFILNPVVGPEPVTGSTRMKSGTATKLLLELIFHLAMDELAVAADLQDAESTLDEDEQLSVSAQTISRIVDTDRDNLLTFFQSCELVHREVYLTLPALAPLIHEAGETLRNGGHIYYLGDDAFGILGLIDASECPPTFGADFHDIRGFVASGWDALENEEGDLSNEGSMYQISQTDFANNILPGVNENDLVVFLNNLDSGEPLRLDLATALKEKNAKLACISIKGFNYEEEDWDNDELDEYINSRFDDEDAEDEDFDEDEDDGEEWELDELRMGDELDELPNLDDQLDGFDDDDDEDDDLLGLSADPVINMCRHHVFCYAGTMFESWEDHAVFPELACKWILNAITTGAHILKGKVYQNRMIDLRISNNKLYYRSIGIISQLMGVDEETARLCLLRSIYGVDDLSEELRNAPISRHIEAGTKAAKIVPAALLLATGQFTIAGAHEALAKDPIVRNIITQYAAK